MPTRDFQALASELRRRGWEWDLASDTLRSGIKVYRWNLYRVTEGGRIRTMQTFDHPELGALLAQVEAWLLEVGP